MGAAAGSVLGLEVVELAGLLRNDLYNGKRLGVVVAQDRNGRLHTRDKCLDQQQVIMLESFFYSGGKVFLLTHHGHADRRSLACRFDHAMLPHSGDNIVNIVYLAALQAHRARRWQANRAIDLLSARLIHCQSAGEHARTRVRKPQKLQQTLHAAIFSIASMERAIDDIRFGADDLADHIVICRINLDNRKSHITQCLSTCRT